MSDKTSALITRRKAIASLASIAAGAMLSPGMVLDSKSDDSKTRFAVIGDFGTGEADEYAVANQMLNSYRNTSYDFVLACGDNIYPNGSGKYFAKHFEQPFEGLLKERVKFYAVLGNHDIEEGRKDQLNYPLFNMA